MNLSDVPSLLTLHKCVSEHRLHMFVCLFVSDQCMIRVDNNIEFLSKLYIEDVVCCDQCVAQTSDYFSAIIQMFQTMP